MFTLGEMMRIKGGPGSGNYSGPGQPRFARNINAEYPVDLTSSLYTHQYGGMPTAGGYHSSTEYEIGHQRYAEAAHCILGSLGKAVSSKYQATYIEESHIREELGIMKKTIEEYSRGVYNDQLEQKRDDPERSHYTDETVKSLTVNSKALSNKVNEFQSKLGDVRPDLKKIANLAYDSLSVLAENAPKISDSLRYNVFKEKALKDVTQKLSDSIDAVYGVPRKTKEKTQAQKRIQLSKERLEDTADVNRMMEILFGKKELEDTITKAKPKTTQKPLSKEQLEFQFRESTNKFEKKFQKTMIEYFKDQEKAALSVLSKGFEDIEVKGGPGSGIRGHVTARNDSGKVTVIVGPRPKTVFQKKFAVKVEFEGRSIWQFPQKWENEGNEVEIPRLVRIGRGKKMPSADADRLTAAYNKAKSELAYVKIQELIDLTGLDRESVHEHIIFKVRNQEASLGIDRMGRAVNVKLNILPNKSFSPSDLLQAESLSEGLGLAGVFHFELVVEGKGGPGSGSWNGPDDPRFAHEEGDGNRKSTISADEVSEILAAHPLNAGKTKNELKEKWVASESFDLMEIPINSVGIASDVEGDSKSKDPIIVDANVNEVGRLASEFGTHGKPPEALVLDGKHRLVQSQKNGEETIQAYVGNKIKEHIEKEKIKFVERKKKVSDAISAYNENPNGAMLRVLRILLPENEVQKIRDERKQKSYFPFDDIEEHLLSPSLGLTRVFPRRKKVIQKSATETQEMKDLFEKRTNLHISLVQKYLQKIIDLKDDRLDNKVLESEKFHDQSKFEEPEYTPYLHVNWHYHLKDKGEEYNPTEEIKNQMDKATFHHVKNNKHHPEYWDKNSTEDNINRNNRDKASEKQVDATKMPLDYVASMVADWLAMSDEKKTDVFDWAKKNINKRWKFTKDQVQLIDDLLKALPVDKKKEIGTEMFFTKASPNALPDRFDFSGWAYKDSKWNKRLQEEGGLFIKEVYEAEGKRVWEQLALQLQDGLEGAFDIDNPLIAKFIENYTFPFAQGINETTVASLQAAMTAGMDEGLGMDGIAKLVREVFDNCTKYRSILIARTETIRASNGAAKMAYQQSEVVESLQWLTTRDDRRCNFCLAMEGKIVGLDENYFELGDSMTVGSGTEKATMKFDYEAVGYPPLHPQCRCAVIPVVYDEYQLPKSVGLDLFFKEGNANSGNYDHAGRPGQVGGSGVGSLSGVDTKQLEGLAGSFSLDSYNLAKDKGKYISGYVASMDDALGIKTTVKIAGDKEFNAAFSTAKMSAEGAALGGINAISAGYRADTNTLWLRDSTTTNNITDKKAVNQLFNRITHEMGHSYHANEFGVKRQDVKTNYGEGWAEQFAITFSNAMGLSRRYQTINASKDPSGWPSKQVAAAKNFKFDQFFKGVMQPLVDDLNKKGIESIILKSPAKDLTAVWVDRHGNLYPCDVQEPDDVDMGKQPKSVGLDIFFKGGPGSGSWEGPDDPRFAHEGKTEYPQTADDIKMGPMGKGWFIAKDGDLIDVTSDFGGGTNDHVGVFQLPEYGEKLGLPKKEIEKLKKMSDKLNDPNFEDDLEGTLSDKYSWLASDLMDLAFKKGVIRVRVFDDGVAIDGDSMTLFKVQSLIEKNKIPADKKNTYFIDGVDSKNYQISNVKYSTLVSANSWEEVAKFSKSEEEWIDQIGLDIFFKGGPGSGNFGHGGRQGQVGGSGDGASTLPIVNQSSNDTMVNAAKTAISEGKSSNEFASAQMAKYKADTKVFWHGSPSGDLRGSAYGLHVGSFAAAEQALNARIGVPAEGSWDGTREYGKTLLAGKKRLLEIDPRGFNQTGANVGHIPEENYYPKGTAKYSDKTNVDLGVKPDIAPVKISGEMTNTRNNPHEDAKANSLMHGQISRGTAKRGFFYTNIGEDEGSISAVVPNANHLMKLPNTRALIDIYESAKGKKSIGLDLFFKGGPGSGNYDGPGQPRFAGHMVSGTRENLPDHIKALKIPPAWTDLQYNEEPEADLLVTGLDKKGKMQYIYSERFAAEKAAEKFERIKELTEKYGSIHQQNEANIKDPANKEKAECLDLIMETGIRPGSEVDTGAEKQAYGATTLLGKHVKVAEDGSVSLQFVGKKGVDLNIPVQDSHLKTVLVQRAKSAGEDGKLFDVDDGELRDYTHTLDGGNFKPKDFRTRLATETAVDEVKKFGKTMPTNMKEYKKMVKTVATVVSKKLGNTPVVALQSYIVPSVFAKWRAGFELTSEAKE